MKSSLCSGLFSGIFRLMSSTRVPRVIASYKTQGPDNLPLETFTHTHAHWGTPCTLLTTFVQTEREQRTNGADGLVWPCTCQKSKGKQPSRDIRFAFHSERGTADKDVEGNKMHQKQKSASALYSFTRKIYRSWAFGGARSMDEQGFRIYWKFQTCGGLVLHS